MLTPLLSIAIALQSAPGTPSLRPSFGSGAVPRPAEPTVNDLVRTELLSDATAIEPGKPFRLAIAFTIAPKWHIYWKNSGDSGAPPTIQLKLPDGFTAGPLEWPAPEIFVSPEETTIGYSERVLLVVPVTPPASIDAIPAQTPIEADLVWMVCKELCLIGRGSVALSLPRSDAASDRVAPKPALTTASPDLELVRLPKPAAVVGVTARVAGARLQIEGPAPEGAEVRFLPLLSPGVSYAATVPSPVVAREGRFRFDLPLTINPNNALGEPLRAAGAILVGDPKSPRLYTEIELPIEGAP